MGAAVLEYLGALQAGVQLVRDARSLYRDWQASKAGAPEELEQKLEQAEQQLKLAEVAAAESRGYSLCRRHWPPGIMVDESSRSVGGTFLDRKRCADCGHVWEWTHPRHY